MNVLIIKASTPFGNLLVKHEIPTNNLSALDENTVDCLRTAASYCKTFPTGEFNYKLEGLRLPDKPAQTLLVCYKGDTMIATASVDVIDFVPDWEEQKDNDTL